MPDSNCSELRPLKKSKIWVMIVKNQPHPDISDRAANIQIHPAPAFFVVFPCFKENAWGESFIQKLLGTAAPRDDSGACLPKLNSRQIQGKNDSPSFNTCCFTEYWERTVQSFYKSNSRTRILETGASLDWSCQGRSLIHTWLTLSLLCF